MRKMFTRIFSLVLLFFMVGFVTELKAQCDVTIPDAAAAVTDIVCGGESTGAITVFSADGGTGQYTYTLQVWQEATWVDVTPYVGVADTVYSGLPYGTYKVVVTDSESCGAETANIDVAGAAPADAVVISNHNFEDMSCNGASDGLIEIWAAGGSGTYQFKINNNNWRDFPEGSSYKDIAVTEAGEYVIQVRDALAPDCTTESVTFIIAEPAPVAVSTAVDNVNSVCSPDGAFTVTISGGHLGTYPVDYNVYVNEVLWSSNISGPSVTYSDLDAGTYNVKVIENWGGENSCEGLATAVITAPGAITGIATVSKNVLCNGGADGEILLSEISGGTTPYHLYLSGPVTADKAYDAAGVNTFAGLTAGTYSVRIEDAVGCDTTIMNVMVEEPGELMLNTTHIQDIVCIEDGKFSVQVSGGAGDYKYYAALSQLPEYITVPDAGSAEWQTDSIFTVTDPGTYIVWAIDANECVIGGEEDDLGNPVEAWTVQIEKPEIEVVVDATVMNAPACNGDLTGSISVEAADVVIYKDGLMVENPVYTVTINDNETNKLDNLGAGTYYIVVTSEDGCVGRDTVTFTEPQVLEAVLDKAEGEFVCPGANIGYIETTVTGGTEGTGFMYQLWQNSVFKTDYQESNSFLVAIDNEYTVVVMDGNGCTDTSNVVKIDPVPPIEFELTDVTCSDDTMASVWVEVAFEEGRMYQVLWQKIETEAGDYTDTSAWFNEPIKLDQKFAFSSEGNDTLYQFKVVDDKGCEAEYMTMKFERVTALELTLTEGDVDGCTTGVTVAAAGGVAPYSLMVNGEVATGTELSLGGGLHDIIVTDAHGCMKDTVLELAYPISMDTLISVYVGDVTQFVYGTIDTMLEAEVEGETIHKLYTDIEAGCIEEVVVTLDARERAMPVLDSVSPNGVTIETNHAVFTIVFTDEVPITFNESVTGYLTVTAVDSTEATLVIPITADMVNGNTITIDYNYMELGALALNTSYTVAVDSGIVMGDGMAWDGVTGSWTFTTGAEYPLGTEPDFKVADFKVYPNPFNEFIRIDKATELDRVVISNIAGQRVLDIEYPDYEIPTGNLNAGVYIITLTADGEIVKSVRLIKR
ncbi:T9SS type A sorting domain-containing protein [uncultured Draconibacterium sp.]|uniref:T9SS type A sorting domain-containing protein n=1 Tax=uncultured Draconibacterium sp. TaxID=1573823 RepID=UPI0029C78AD4|nr:T9SS type A sorting domain-containing protein [uncultured Draconibacterium sp.]